MRIRDFLLFAVIVCSVAACYTNAPPSKGWVGDIVAYQKAVSEQHGIVGYVKTYQYTRPNHADSFQLYRVYDLNFRERGFVNERGTGQKYTYLTPGKADALEKTVHSEELEAQPLAYNVGVILDVSGPLKLAKASAADLSTN